MEDDVFTNIFLAYHTLAFWFARTTLIFQLQNDKSVPLKNSGDSASCFFGYNKTVAYHGLVIIRIPLISPTKFYTV